MRSKPIEELVEGDYAKLKGRSGLWRLDPNPNPNWKEDEESFIDAVNDWGQTLYLNSVDEIEELYSDAEVNNRPLPTAAEIASMVSSALVGSEGDDIFVTETNIDGSSVYVFAEAKNALPIAFRVTITEVEKSMV